MSPAVGTLRGWQHCVVLSRSDQGLYGCGRICTGHRAAQWYPEAFCLRCRHIGSPDIESVER
jgi:hypothetical protein